MAAALAAEGAFVIEGNAGIPAWHLHHFPLRAAIPPRAGRVICADLADHLVTWLPDRRSRLHSVPREADAAERHLRRAMGTGGFEAATLLNLHRLQCGRQPGRLAGLDALAGRMAGLFDALPAGWVFTAAEPMDEPGKRADLLLLTR